MEYVYSDEELDTSEFSRKRPGKYAPVIREFLEGENRNLVFTLSSEKETLNCFQACTNYIRHHKLSLVVYKQRNKVYVCRR